MTHWYYDPQAGRFLTRDPMGYAGGLNLYAYCGNDRRPGPRDGEPGRRHVRLPVFKAGASGLWPNKALSGAGNLL